MKKKLLCLVLAMALILTMVPAQVFAASAREEKTWDAYITYDQLYDGGTQQTDTYSGNTGYYTTITLRDNWSNREGYTFKGWSLLPFGSAMYQAGDAMTVTSLLKTSRHITLYAVWGPRQAPYVKYVDEDGVTQYFDLEVGEEIYISYNEYDPYYENGWTWVSRIDVEEDTVLDLSEESNDYVPASAWCLKYSENNTIPTFFPIFDKVSLTYLDIQTSTEVSIQVPRNAVLSINANGGKYKDGGVEYSNLTKPLATDYTAGSTADIIKKNDANFKGYILEEPYYDGNVYRVGLWAVWAGQGIITITYQPVGSNSTTVASVQRGIDLTVNPNDGYYNGTYDGHGVSTISNLADNIEIYSSKYHCNAEGYVLDGWNYDTDTFGNVTLYARIKPSTVTVSFDDSQNSTSAVAIRYGTAVVVNPYPGYFNGTQNLTNVAFTSSGSIDKPTRTGYTFDGWECAWQDNDNFEEGGYYVLTAKWTNKVKAQSELTYLYCDGGENCYITSVAGVTDVYATAWYHDGVHFCLERGIMNPIPGTQAVVFNPGSPATRGEVICALWALDQQVALDNSTGIYSLDDYTQALAWATGAGIVNGRVNAEGQIDYAPGETITRQELAQMFQRYVGNVLNENVNLSDFNNYFAYNSYTDQYSIAPWAVNAVTWAARSSLILGLGNTVFGPNLTVSRAQLATVLVRTYEMY